MERSRGKERRDREERKGEEGKVVGKVEEGARRKKEKSGWKKEGKR